MSIIKKEDKLSIESHKSEKGNIKFNNIKTYIKNIYIEIQIVAKRLRSQIGYKIKFRRINSFNNQKIKIFQLPYSLSVLSSKSNKFSSLVS